MPIAITEDHRTLAATAADFLAKHDALGAARALLDGADESLPAFWDDLVALGWLGLHVPEEHGGSGYGIEELAVVVEQLGRTLTPGPFVPTVIASALLAATGGDAAVSQLPGLVDGTGGADGAASGRSAASDGARRAAAEGFVSGGTRRNLEWVWPHPR